MKFEYTCIDVYGSNPVGIDELNRLGNEGWELVAMHDCKKVQFDEESCRSWLVNATQVIFKRQVA